jgi:hypothetical protein
VSNALVSSPALALTKNHIYVGWDEWGFNSAPPYTSGGRLMITSSSHGRRLNFDSPEEIARTNIGFGQVIPAMPEKGVGPNLSLAVDPKKDDRVYAVFADRGRTWQAVTVSDDANPSDQFSPGIALDSDGNVKVSFYDTRLSSAFETAHVFLAKSSGDESFDTERITTSSSNDSKSNPLRDYTANLGDRTAIAMTDGDVLVAWTDTRLDSEDVFFSIVFDPDGEFVSGSGEILSPAGAFPAYPTLTGKAEFGFVAKYKARSSVPDGDTEFSFALGKLKLRFKSTSYEQLVVTGATAQLTGSGKVNGEGNFSFQLTLIDGNQPGAGGVDRFRIKIVDITTGTVVYDNAVGTSGTPQPITEGKIRIHNN